MEQKENVLVNGFVMAGEISEMKQEFICSDEDGSITKDGSVSTSDVVDGGTVASDQDVEYSGKSWWCGRDKCSGSRALRRHWFVGEVIHLTRLAAPLVSIIISGNLR